METKQCITVLQRAFGRCEKAAAQRTYIPEQSFRDRIWARKVRMSSVIGS